MYSQLALLATIVAFSASAPLPNIVNAPTYVFGGAHLSNQTFGNFDARRHLVDQGSCGWTNSSSDFVASIKTNNTDLTQVCGMQINVTDASTGRSVLAQIVDECVDCSYDYLLLSPAAYDAVSDKQNFTATYTFSNSTASNDYSSNSGSGSGSGSGNGSGSGSNNGQGSGSSRSSSDNDNNDWQPATSSSRQEQQQYTHRTTSTPEWTPETTSSRRQTQQEQEYTPRTTSTTPEWRPTTTSRRHTTTQQQQQQEEAPRTTRQSSNSGGGGGGQYHGTATYYYQGGNPGNCGQYNSDSAFIVAMNSAQYGGSCGRSVRITNTNTGSSVTARVADQCPSCSYGSIDLSVAVFSSLGSLSDGVFPISWSWA